MAYYELLGFIEYEIRNLVLTKSDWSIQMSDNQDCVSLETHRFLSGLVWKCVLVRMKRMSSIFSDPCVVHHLRQLDSLL
jgi:hypothetical protein